MECFFDRYAKEPNQYEIEKVALIRATNRLRIEIAADTIVPYTEITTIKEDLKDLLPDVSGVDLFFDYRQINSPSEGDILAYLPYLVGEIAKEDAFYAHSISTTDVKVKENTIYILALGEKVTKVLNKKVAGIFQGLLQDAFGISFQVVFINDKESYDAIIKKAKDEEKKASVTVPAPKPKTGVSGAKKTGNGKKPEIPTGNRILGKAVTVEPGTMKAAIEATDTGGQICVQGEIFQLDTKDIRREKKIITILFSDGTTSMCGKFFIANDKWEVLEDILKPGVFIKVRGKFEFDTFANEMVLMAKDISLGSKPTRSDDMEEKRVELHAHTNMSDLDGLNDASAIVKQAIAWGQPAVAITDHGVVQSFPTAARAAGDKIKVLYGMEGYVFDDSDCILEDGTIDYKKKRPNHIILLARNHVGLKNLYKLVSISHMEYFYRRPLLPWSVLSSMREGLLVGSACEAGEVFRAITNGAEEEVLFDIASRYDYLEIQPIINNSFMLQKGLAQNEEQLRDFNRKVIQLGQQLEKPVVATTDAHYGEPSDYIYRNIVMAARGFDVDQSSGQGLYLRTTKEMLEEFSYLGEDTAYQVVVENTNAIADLCEIMQPVPEGKFPPEIKDSEKILRDTCEKRTTEKYGSPLPEPIRARLDKELESIIGNGYAVMYVAAKMLVDKSMEDGYLVGSRGSVGSSFVATMAGITEVNPLPPHYICPNCKHLQWGDEAEYDCGVDMPEKICPECETVMEQDGFAIPFETFLGFYGDKEPDIDLNFAGEYQVKAHKYVEVIFGSENVYKAGTIGTLAEKTAYGYVMKYFEEKGIPVNKYEAERLKLHCVGVKRTTGQHPGGIIIVPRGHEIYEFCPVQHPANDRNSGIVTTHFDYHSIDQNLLKLDILGHESPSMIRHLQDMTGMCPLQVKLNDKKVMSIFTSIEGLDIKDPDYKFTHGTYGISEFGTKFVRQMLDDTKPDKFADLVRISGFSHGTDVWLNNAQEFIRSGQATMKEAISTRDDIMNYLILKGVPKGEAFNIMEKVRKGKGVTEERVALMQEHGVPEWYIESCRRIQYMFPRAHAVAYVTMSFRTAYYKVYYPLAFYAVYFTSKVTDFNWDVIKEGSQACLRRMEAIGLKEKNATAKEKNEMTVLEVCYEMYSRGFTFMAPNLEDSLACDFTVKDGKVLVPLSGLDGVGTTVACSIYEEQHKQPFGTIEEIQMRAKANKTAIEALRLAGMVDDLPETDQLSLF